MIMTKRKRKTKRKSKAKGKIKIFRNKKRVIQLIKNTKGKLKPLAISQRGDYQGFTAHYKKRPFRKVARSKHAEKMGVRLAKKGHKSIEFWD